MVLDVMEDECEAYAWVGRGCEIVGWGDGLGFGGWDEEGDGGDEEVGGEGGFD